MPKRKRQKKNKTADIVLNTQILTAIQTNKKSPLTTGIFISS